MNLKILLKVLKNIMTKKIKCSKIHKLRSVKIDNLSYRQCEHNHMPFWEARMEYYVMDEPVYCDILIPESLIVASSHLPNVKVKFYKQK